MRILPIVAAATFIFLAPAAVSAQELPEAGYTQAETLPPETEAGEAALAQMSDKLADPDFQTQVAAISKVLVNTLLDLEVGTIVQAADDASDGALSGGGSDIEPDARLRDMVRGADSVGEDIAEKLPQAMNTMSAMSEGLAAMLPALKAMAQQMGDTLGTAGDSSGGSARSAD